MFRKLARKLASSHSAARSRRRARLSCEQLEPRLLMAADFSLLPAWIQEDQVAAVQHAIEGITTTGSQIADVELQVVELSDDGIAPQTSISAPLIGWRNFRNDARFAGIDGGGFAVAVLDTGIDLNHPFFGPDNDGNGIADRIVFQFDFSGNNDNNASDTNNHGSHVSSTIASQDGTFSGIAPGVDIIHLKVFPDGANPLANTSDIEEALQWVVQNASRFSIAAVNLSLGGGNFSAIATSALSDEFAALASMGVIPVVAAGNGYVGAAGVSNYAADPNTIAVGAVWSANWGGPFNWASGATDITTAADRVTAFSQRHGTLTDAMAPGAFITAANRFGGTAAMSGTSMAAPHVAGAVVLAQDVATTYLGRRLSYGELQQLLRSTGVWINDGDNENDNVANTGLNFPRLDVHRLAIAILELPQHFDHFVSGDFNGDGVDDKFYHGQQYGNNQVVFGQRGGGSGTRVLTPIGVRGVNGEYETVVAGDFNGDGRDDLLFHDVQGGLNRWAFGRADGTFAFRSEPLIAHSAINSEYDNVTAGDFDGDGYDDLLFHASGSGNNRWAFGRADGTFDLDTDQAHPIIAQTAVNGEFNNLVAGDFNGDGRHDLLFHAGASGNNRWAFGRGDRTFELFTDQSAPIID